MSAAKPRSVLGLVFLTVFLDLAGFSVVFPLFPALLEHYLALEGEHSLLGRLVAELAQVAGDEPMRVATLFGGLLGSIYSILQFLCAPLWGALSDRIGRRPTLLITLAGMFLSYVGWFFAGSFALLVAARMLGGSMAGNIATANAVVADTTEGPDRVKGMGIVGMAIGLGFILGPALGGWFGAIDLTERWPELARFGVNPFSAAAAAAAALSLANWLWVAARYPETLPPERRARAEAGEARAGFGALKRMSSLAPGVRRASLTFFLYLLSFSAMEFSLMFLAADRFDFGVRDTAALFVFIGLTIAVVQGGLVRRLAPRLGERRLVLAGFGILVLSFAWVGACDSVRALYTGAGGLALGSALAMPSLGALVSRYTSADRQGLALGSYQASGALARAFGPILGGLLYWKLGSAAPYYAGAGFLLLPIALAAGLPAPALLPPSGPGPAPTSGGSSGAATR